MHFTHTRTHLHDNYITIEDKKTTKKNIISYLFKNHNSLQCHLYVFILRSHKALRFLYENKIDTKGEKSTFKIGNKKYFQALLASTVI